MYTNKNWLKWIMNSVFKTIYYRFILVASFLKGFVYRCLDFQTKNVSFRPYQVKHRNISFILSVIRHFRSIHPEVFLEKVFWKYAIKFTGEHSCQSAISIKLQSNFIEIALQHWCSPVNLLHIFRMPFLKNTFGWLFLTL